MHTLFDGLEFRVLRDRLFETLESEEEIDDSGFDAGRHPARARARSAAWLAEHAARPATGSAWRVRGTWGAGTGDVLVARARGRATAPRRGSTPAR